MKCEKVSKAGIKPIRGVKKKKVKKPQKPANLVNMALQRRKKTTFKRKDSFETEMEKAVKRLLINSKRQFKKWR